MPAPKGPIKEVPTPAWPPASPWKKGQSGNPGGRPKGFQQAIRTLCGPGGEEIIATAVAFMRAKPVTIRLPSGKYFEADPSGEAMSKDGPVAVMPSVHERLEAAKFLAERLAGKAPQAVTLSGPGGGPIAVAGVAHEAAQLAALTDEELLQVERARALLDAAPAPALPAGDVVDAEFAEEDAT